MKRWIRLSVHTILIFLSIILIFLQTFFNWIPFNQYYTPESAIFMGRLYTIVWLVVLAFGISLREVRTGVSSPQFFKTFFTMLLIFIGVPVLIGMMGGLMDVATPMDYHTQGNGLWVLDSLGGADGFTANALEIYLLSKIAFLCIPLLVIIVGVISFWRSDDVDGYITAALEFFGGIACIVIATFALNLVGVDLWNFDPQIIGSIAIV